MSADTSFQALLATLDMIKPSFDEPIIKTLTDAEYVETQLTFAMRKLHAARYHLTNVERMLGESSQAAESQIPPGTSSLPSSAKYKITIQKSQPNFVYELGAFMVAIRSGLDFLATIMGRSMKGVICHSIHDLEKMVVKGLAAPVLEVVDSHGAWLVAVREYRDEIVHRLIMATPSGGMLTSKHELVSTATIPIIVPIKTPSRRSDTRRSRMLEEEAPPGLVHQERTVYVTYGDGTTKVLEHEVNYSPAPNFELIEKFMSDHLAAYDAFLDDVMKVLANLNFKALKVG